MAALIEFLCIASHDTRGEPSVTLEQRSWAYCSAGASADHQWTRIDPTAVETLRSRPTNGSVHLTTEKNREAPFTGRPAR